LAENESCGWNLVKPQKAAAAAAEGGGGGALAWIFISNKFVSIVEVQGLVEYAYMKRYGEDGLGECTKRWRRQFQVEGNGVI